MTELETKLLAQIKGLLSDIEGLMGESSGVYGLHLNGDVSPWDELDEGGRFERLTHLSSARSAIAEAACRSHPRQGPSMNTYLCVGGPLDGQYRTMPDDRLSFRVDVIPLTPELSAARASRQAPKFRASVIEYQLVWSREHKRFVWWSDK